MSTRYGLFVRKKGWRDPKQAEEWNHHHAVIRGILIEEGSPMSVFEIRDKAISNGEGISRESIYSHLEQFIKDCEVRKIGSEYVVDHERVKLWATSHLDNVMDKIRYHELEGIVKASGVNPDGHDWIYYEMCVGEKNKDKWKEMRYYLQVDKKLIPRGIPTVTDGGKTFAALEIPKVIVSALVQNVDMHKIKWSDMPEKVLIACVVDTKRLKKSLQKVSAKMKK